MTLKDKFQKDLNDSLRSGDKLKRSVLGMLMTAIHNRELMKRTQLSKTIRDTKELEEKSALSDAEILEVVAGEAKKRKESIEQFKAGGRHELAEKEAEELKMLTAYLPEQLSEKEIEEEVNKAILESGAKDIKDIGRVIGLAMAKLKGRADGNVVSRIAKEKLSK